MVITLKVDTLDLLTELQVMWGLSTLDEVVARLARDKLAEFDQPETIQSKDLHPNWPIPNSISSAVDKVTQYDAGGEVTLNPTIIPPVDAKPLLSLEDIYATADKKDMVIANIQEYSDGEKQIMEICLVELYNVLPRDIWGTLQAQNLFARQMTFKRK